MISAGLARVPEPGGGRNYDQCGRDAPAFRGQRKLGIVLRLGRILSGVAYLEQCAALLFSQAMTVNNLPAHAMTSGSET